jgi:hypothetical protein
MKPLSRYTIVFISVVCLLLPKKIVRACGWWVEPAEYRFWLMQPNVTNMNDLGPFFVACIDPDDHELGAAANEINNTNVEEWYKETKKGAAKNDIREILYKTKPGVMLDSLEYLKKHNSFVRYLSKPGNEELFRYLLLSKKVEVIATHPDAWEERPAADPLIDDIIKSADSLYRNSRTEFVRLRTAYQTIRLYRYHLESGKAIKTYDSLVAPVKSGSYIKAAALYEKAGLMKGPEEDYLLSKVFDMGYRRGYCGFYFSSDSLKKILPFARNDHERVVLYTMKALNYKGRSLKQIQYIYSQEPAYDQLPFLLVREINKIEDWLVTSRVTQYTAALKEDFGDENYNYAQDKQYAREFYAFLVKLIGEQKADNTALLELLASHLMLVLEDYDLSARHLAAAKQYPGLPSNVQLQIRINELLLYTLTQNQFDKKAEDMFVDLVNLPDDQFPAYEPGLLKDQLTLFIGKTLMNRGELTKGVMILARTHRAYGDLIPVGSYRHIYIELDEAAGPAHYDSILYILTKKNKTAFEKYLSLAPVSSPYSYNDYHDEPTHFEPAWDRHRLLDGKASWYLRHDSLEQALKTLQQIPASYYDAYPFDNLLRNDPFTVDVDNGHRNDRYEPVCSKLEMVKEMIRLQKIAKEDPSKAALCYLQLGNAHFNMTWYGKNWLAVKQYWSHYHMDAESLERSAFNDNYFGCQRARDYYLKALKLAKDKKLASLSCFLAGKCQENYMRYYFLVSDMKNNPKAKNPYISLLKKKGYDTDYLNDMIKECATYDLFRAEVRRMQP